MGLYINPAKESKEDFLKRDGVLVTMQAAREMDIKAEDKDVLVCWIDNNWMTAALIVADMIEHSRVFDRSSSDNRPRTYYLVPKTKLFEMDPTLEQSIHLMVKAGIG